MSRKDLTMESDNIIKRNPQLNSQHPERRGKANTYVVDFRGIEANKEPLNDFERECLASISVNPAGEMRLMLDLNLMMGRFPNAEQVILQKKREGYTDQEIADLINMARRTVIRKLHMLFGKLRQILI